MLSIKQGITNEALNFFKENIEQVGTVKSITHTRNIDKIYYKTVITGENNSMVIEGGLTSGYMGQGAKGLKKVLVTLGLDEITAEKYVFGNADIEHEFTINF